MTPASAPTPQLRGYRAKDGMPRLGTVQIGNLCFTGIHSALGLGVRMGHGSSLDDQSLLLDGDTIPPGGRGSPPPARRRPRAGRRDPAVVRQGKIKS